MPEIITLQQIINALVELDDDELQELRDEIDDEIEDREAPSELIEGLDEDEDEEEELWT
jgi:hypothetical protein